MALKPPFPSLYHFPEISGPEAFPRRPSLHGLSYPWVSGNHTVIALLLHCLIWLRRGWATPPPRRRLALATPCLYLGDASSCRLYAWATPWVDFDFPVVDFDLVNALIRDGTGFLPWQFGGEATSLCTIVVPHGSWCHVNAQFPMNLEFKESVNLMMSFTNEAWINAMVDHLEKSMVRTGFPYEFGNTLCDPLCALWETQQGPPLVLGARLGHPLIQTTTNNIWLRTHQELHKKVSHLSIQSQAPPNLERASIEEEPNINRISKVLPSCLSTREVM